jgi:hypothetical protein
MKTLLELFEADTPSQMMPDNIKSQKIAGDCRISLTHRGNSGISIQWDGISSSA